MRSLFGALSLLMLTCASQPAVAYDYPWCAHYGGRSAATNCGFVSFEQCRWTVSGIGGHCARNPFYAAAHDADRPRPKLKRKPQQS